MKNLLIAYFTKLPLYASSLGVGSILSTIISFFVENTPAYLFGINVAIWFILFVINIIDIHTGIKADKVRCEREGKVFKFQSGKGWRAIEKIFVFSMMVWFIHTMEFEAIRVQAFDAIPITLRYIKFIMLSYVMLIELQSIGENEETRFEKKGKMFILLDNIIAIVNDGIFTNLKKLLRIE